MSSPDRPFWTPARIALWAGAAVLVALWLGPRFVAAFRPPEGAWLDFSQEWLSAKNYRAGTPVYADQTEALKRHTGQVPAPGQEMLPWNAHPPAATVAALPFGKLPYRDAHLAWNLLTFPLFLASLWLIARELRVRLAPWSVLPVAALLLLFNPLLIQLLQGQWNPPILFLLTVAWVADRHERPGWAGVSVGLATGFKLFPGLLFVYLLFARRWRALATGAATCAAVNAVALVLLGPDELRTYIEKVVPWLSDTYRGDWRNVSLTGYWLRAFDPHPRSKIVPLAGSPAVAVALLWASRALVVGGVCWRSWRARSVEARDRGFALTVVGMLLVSPLAWTHYFILLALPVGLLCARLPAGPLRWVMWLAVIPLWFPDTFFALPAIGFEQARAMNGNRHNPLSPLTNLLALSAFTYALVALFVLTALTPAGSGAPEPPAGREEPDPPAPPTTADSEDDDARLNRRLFGPVGGG